MKNVLIIILILVVGFASYVGYTQYTQYKKNQRIQKTETPNIPVEQNKISARDWKSLSKADLIGIIGENAPFEKDGPVGISQEIDLTGDGINEAIVGGNGGNNDTYIILIKNVDGTTSVAKQKEYDGKINPVNFLSVGRVMFSYGYKLLPEEHGYYMFGLNYDEKSETFKCPEKGGVGAYSWNSEIKLFEYNQVMTAKYTAQVCK